MKVFEGADEIRHKNLRSFVKKYLVTFVDCLVSEPWERVCYPSYKFLTIKIVCYNEIVEAKPLLQ